MLILKEVKNGINEVDFMKRMGILDLIFNIYPSKKILPQISRLYTGAGFVGRIKNYSIKNLRLSMNTLKMSTIMVFF